MFCIFMLTTVQDQLMLYYRQLRNTDKKCPQNRKTYSTDLKLQVVKCSSKNGEKKRRRCFVYLRGWCCCSEGTPMKNSMDFSDLKGDGKFAVVI